MDKLIELQKKIAESDLAYSESIINYDDDDKCFLTVFIDDERYIDITADDVAAMTLDEALEMVKRLIG